jgi:hypothetical protein
VNVRPGGQVNRDGRNGAASPRPRSSIPPAAAVRLPESTGRGTWPLARRPPRHLPALEVEEDEAAVRWQGHSGQLRMGRTQVDVLTGRLEPREEVERHLQRLGEGLAVLGDEAPGHRAGPGREIADTIGAALDRHRPGGPDQGGRGGRGADLHDLVTVAPVAVAAGTCPAPLLVQLVAHAGTADAALVEADVRGPDPSARRVVRRAAAQDDRQDEAEELHPHGLARYGLSHTSFRTATSRASASRPG